VIAIVVVVALRRSGTIWAESAILTEGAFAALLSTAKVALLAPLGLDGVSATSKKHPSPGWIEVAAPHAGVSNGVPIA